jgi:diguanylate cyclase (GGDEF)-like protein
MTSSGFAYPNLFGKQVPAPAPRWAGNAEFNFIGGHNDRTLIPIEELIAATAAVLRREGTELALYGMGQGPQGYPGLRRFVADKVRRWRGIDAGPDDVLITQGSGQAIDLVNAVLVEAGDEVLIPNPGFVAYPTITRMAGGTPTFYRLTAAHDFSFDLDDFKQVNDRFGHSVGDVVLQSVTKLLWEALRQEDGIFRYGGEEFAVLLKDVTDTKMATIIAERLRAALDSELTINNFVSVKLSASLGVALHPLHGAGSPRALLDAADDAAYQAKRNGKNQVVVAPLPDSD